MKNDINICYLIDDKFLELTLKSIEYIQKFYRGEEHQLNFFIIGTNQFDVPETITYIPTCSPDLPLLHQRAFIPEMINTDKLIFLDSDTITTTCISKLWDTDLQSNIVGAVQSSQTPCVNTLIEKWDFNFAPFVHNREAMYFDAGVMMIDCVKWKANNITQKTLDVFETYQHTKYRGHDEPGFTISLANNWLSLDEKWNYIPSSRPNRTKGWKRSYIMQWAGDDNEKLRHDHFYTTW